MPCGVMPAAHSASAAFTYTRVGCSSASAIRRPVPGTWPSRLRPPFLNSACLAREYPLLCRPELGSPITTSPGRTLLPSSGVRSERHGADRGADQVERGAAGLRLGEHLADLRDLAAGDGDAGQLRAEEQPAGHLVEHALVDPVGGDVVEQRERHRADADQVVDVVRHAVDADRLPAAGLLGQHDLGAHAVGGQRDRRARAAGA